MAIKYLKENFTQEDCEELDNELYSIAGMWSEGDGEVENIYDQVLDVINNCEEVDLVTELNEVYDSSVRDDDDPDVLYSLLSTAIDEYSSWNDLPSIYDESKKVTRGRALTEAFHESLPLWLKQWLKQNFGNANDVLHGYQWDKAEYEELPIPNSKREVGSNPNSLMIYRLDPRYTQRSPYSTDRETPSSKVGNVYIPGVNNIRVEDKNGDMKQISNVPFKDWKDYIIECGQISFDYNTNDIRKQRNAVDWSNDRYHRGRDGKLHYGGQYQYKTRYGYGNYWDINRDWDGSRDKSGYIINPNKYKDMLKQKRANGEYVSDNLTKAYNELISLRTDLSAAFNATDPNKPSGYDSDISNVENAMSYYRDAIHQYGYAMQNLDTYKKAIEDGKEASRYEYELKAANEYLKQCREYIKDARYKLSKISNYNFNII